MPDLISHLRRHPYPNSSLYLLTMFLFATELLPRDVCLAEEPEAVGYVSYSAGRWQYNGEEIRQNGERVYPGALITLDPANAKNPLECSISIVYLSGEREEFSGADQPIKVKMIEHETGPENRFVRAVIGLFVKRAENYIVAAVRGGGSLRLQEAVVKLEDGKVDLAPVFDAAPPGSYLARFELIEREEEGGDDASQEPQEIVWKADRQPLLTSPGLRTGLWRVSLLGRRDQRPLRTDAWVLICSPVDYAQAAESFERATELTRSWGEKVNVGEVRSFLRASLDLLREQTKGE
jgi:hypothetical protein